MDLRERLMPCISSSHAETCAAKVHRPAFNPAQVLDALADHEPLTPEVELHTDQLSIPESVARLVEFLDRLSPQEAEGVSI